MAAAILSVGFTIFIAYFLTALFKRTRIPDVLVLMLLGILVGPVLRVVSPADFGKVGAVATTIALIVILFESGINLSVKTLRSAMRETLLISITSYIVTMLVITFSVLLIARVNLLTAFLVGSILGGTSSAVVVPMIKLLKMKELPKTVLFLESAITDVLCIVVAFSLIGAFKQGSISTGIILGQIVASLVLASIIGAVGAVLWSVLLNKVKNFPDTVFSTFAYIFVLYGISELLGYSGAIASLAFGITLANIPTFPMEKVKMFRKIRFEEVGDVERSFYSEIVFLLKTFFFVYLGISIQLSDIGIIATSLGITVLFFLARIEIIRYLMPTGTTRSDAVIMSIIVPKGLAAAVLASIPLQAGMPYGETIQGLAYGTVFFSILLSALLIPLTEKTVLGKLYNKIFSNFSNKDNAADSEAAAAIT